MTTERRIESAINRAVWYRNYRRARERALVKLSQLYPETYKQLFEIERSIDEQEGKSWIDITGATRVAISTGTPDWHITDTRETDSQTGDNGGEA